MKLWKIVPKHLAEGVSREGTDWEWPYDKVHGFVVRAHTEEDARQLVAEHCYDEGEGVWLDSEKTVCRHLKPSGKAEVVMVDSWAG